MVFTPKSHRQEQSDKRWAPRGGDSPGIRNLLGARGKVGQRGKVREQNCFRALPRAPRGQLSVMCHPRSEGRQGTAMAEGVTQGTGGTASTEGVLRRVVQP